MRPFGLPGILLASVILALPASSLFAATGPKPFKVALDPQELPLSSFKSISTGVTLRSAPSKETPRGFDTLFDGVLGESDAVCQRPAPKP